MVYTRRSQGDDGDSNKYKNYADYDRSSESEETDDNVCYSTTTKSSINRTGKRSGRHLLDDSGNEDDNSNNAGGGGGSRRHNNNKVDEESIDQQYEDCGNSNSRQDGEDDDERDGLRRSNRKRKMKFQTFNTNIIQDDYLGMDMIHDRSKSQSVGSPPTAVVHRNNNHSSGHHKRGQGVGKGGIKRDQQQHFSDSEKEEPTDMYSRVKRKRVRPAFYVEHDDEHGGGDDASSVEYVRVRKHSKKRTSRSSRPKSSKQTQVLNERPMRMARLRSQRITLDTSDDDDDHDDEEDGESGKRNRKTSNYSRHSYGKASSRSNTTTNLSTATAAYHRGRLMVSPSEGEMHSPLQSSSSHQHNTRLSSSTNRNPDGEHNNISPQNHDIKQEEVEDSEDEGGVKVVVRRSGRVASKRGKGGGGNSLNCETKSSDMNGGEESGEEGENETNNVKEDEAGSVYEDAGEENEDDDDEESDEEEESEKQGRRYPMRDRRQRVPYLIQSAAKQPRTRENHKWSLSSPPKERGRFHNTPRRFRVSRTSSDSSSSSGASVARRHPRAMPLNMRSKEFMTENRRNRLRAALSLADVDPLKIDKSVTFEAIGGNEQQIQALKESVLLPLLYPDLFRKLGIHPARGLLFHGPPGTGKTLLARALANECSLGQRKVAFFMRKGADCLSKWVGESERQLRLLFDEAHRMRPSIIFFDEIDGLAPVRSSRQDQIHSSIVSTLLGLIDGLDDRGEIVIIGATNRVDSIDPALRRPGRFDREFIFFPPDEATRSKILMIHSSKGEIVSSNLKDNQTLLKRIAQLTAGFTGADLRALVTEASLCALRRVYPQVYSSKARLDVCANNIKVDYVDYLQALNVVQPTSQRLVAFHSKPLPSILEPLLNDAISIICYRISCVFPYVPRTAIQKVNGNHMGNETLKSLQSQLPDEVQKHPSIVALCHGSVLPSDHTLDMTINTLLYNNDDNLDAKSSYHKDQNALLAVDNCHLQDSCMLRNPRLFLPGPISTHLMSAVFHKLDKVPIFTLSVCSLHGNGEYSSREECMSQIVRQALRSTPAILYLPEVDELWQSLTPVAQKCLSDLLNMLPHSPAHAPILILASSSQPLDTIISVNNNDNNSNMSTTTTAAADEETDMEVDSWKIFVYDFFSGYLLSSLTHSSDQRHHFFHNVFLIWPFLPPKVISQEYLQEWTIKMQQPLAEVEPPPPAPLSEKELRKLYDEEEEILRGIRMYMRHVINKLGTIRRFFIFSRAVDPEDVPDYYDVIKKPMDLNSILDNIDAHRYHSVKDFEKDLELIYTNALEYNPSTVPKSRDVRHRASDFLDVAYSLCRAMTSDMRYEYEMVYKSRAERAKHMNNLSESTTTTTAAAVTVGGGDDGGMPILTVQTTTTVPTITNTPTTNTTTSTTIITTAIDQITNVTDDVNCIKLTTKVCQKNGMINGHSGNQTISSPQSDCHSSNLSKSLQQQQQQQNSNAKSVSDPGCCIGLDSWHQHGGRHVVGVSKSKMKHLLKLCVESTSDWNIPQLEHLHTKLSQVVNRYRYDWDRKALVEEMEQVLKSMKVKC